MKERFGQVEARVVEDVQVGIRRTVGSEGKGGDDTSRTPAGYFVYKLVKFSRNVTENKKE